MKIKTLIILALLAIQGITVSAQNNNTAEGRNQNSAPAVSTATMHPIMLNPSYIFTSDQDEPNKDQVINDDLIVTSSIGVGFDCIDGEAFGFNTIMLKENNVRIRFEDTSVPPFPDNDWTIIANETASGGANYLAIEDGGTASIPFKLIAGAPTNALYIAPSGNIGFKTASPVTSVHSVNGNTPGLRLDQDASGGWTPQAWDVAGNEANFFIRDVTHGSFLPFRIQPNSPTNTLTLKADGFVGIGTWTPTSTLHVVGNIQIEADTTLSPIGGMIRYIDNDFYGYNGTEWKSLTQPDQAVIDSLELQIANLTTLIDSIFVRLNDCCPPSGFAPVPETSQAKLFQNIPNPTDGTTQIPFFIPETTKSATLLFHDLTGKQVLSLNINERGQNAIIVTLDQFEAGIYTYSLLLDGKLSCSKKMVLAN